jgi:hypothetical protein
MRRLDDLGPRDDSDRLTLPLLSISAGVQFRNWTLGDTIAIQHFVIDRDTQSRILGHPHDAVLEPDWFDSQLFP